MAKTPPGLTNAQPNSVARCGTCTHFKGGKCALHSNYPVRADQVCNDWEPNSRAS